MVQLMESGNLPAETEIMSSSGKKVTVKLEIAEDPLEEDHEPLNKRYKPSQAVQQWGAGANAFPIPPAHNPLDEPSPLGLRLRKSPSLLDLIQMRLAQAGASVLGSEQTESNNSGVKKETNTTAASGITDKLKASNFPASILRIGNWEYKSRYEGDLVAKCYFAKHKLVWEVLDGGLKNKIEIQWSDIVAIKANFPDDGPETLDVVLARQPLFFRETNPQPRKHTLWQTTSDFTGGQASMHRRHFLQCQQGFLGKHFEKLVQCDPRLNFLSQQPEILLETPYFELRGPPFGDLNESAEVLDSKAEDRPSVFALGDAASPSGGLSSSLNDEHQVFIGRTPESCSQETPSPSTVMDNDAVEEIRSLKTGRQKIPSHWDQIKVPGIQPSMSMSDLVNHLGQCISEQISGNPYISNGDPMNRDILGEITQYLLSDTQLTSASDEQCLMSRVNSLCCLLQRDPGSALNLQAKGCIDLEADVNERIDGTESLSAATCQNKFVEGFPVSEDQSNSVSSCKQPPSMSRKDSVGELLLNLPRIASLPQFLHNM